MDKSTRVNIEDELKRLQLVVTELKEKQPLVYRQLNGTTITTTKNVPDERLPQEQTMKECLDKKILNHYVKMAKDEMERSFLEGSIKITLAPRHTKFLDRFVIYWRDQGMVCRIPLAQNPQTTTESIQVMIEW